MSRKLSEIKQQIFNRYYNISTISGGTIGMIVSFPYNDVPEGYLECDGSTISRTAYADLFNIIGVVYGEGDGSTTFRIPDLRGEFIRGWDNGRGVDSGRVFGNWQNHMLSSHTHNVWFRNNYGSGGLGGLLPFSWSGYTRNNIGSTGGTETRPRNIAMMFCIKY